MRRMRLGPASWRWFLWGLLAAGGIAFVSFSPDASGLREDDVYTGAPVRVSATAVVDVRKLAEEPAPPEPASAPEPGERGEQPMMPRLPVLPSSVRPLRATAPSPYLSASFRAQTDAPLSGKKTESPPDTNGAVGLTKLMSTLNSNYAIQRKSDGKLLSKVSMTAFWRPVGAHHPFDPRVLYDPYSDRWLVAAGDDPTLGTSKILYGISDTGDPQGGWHLYAIDADPANVDFADFPTLGFNQDTVAIGINMFANDDLTYVRGRLIVLDYASLRAGGNGRPLDLSVPTAFALQPAITYSRTEPNLYLVEHVDSMSATYRFWSLRDGILSLVGGDIKTNPLGPWGTPGPGNFIPQQDGRGIDAGDSRASDAVFRNGHLYYAQAINMPPSGTGYGLRTAVQWVELDTSGAFVQGGRVEDTGASPWNGGHSYAFPSIAVNSRNDVLLGFSEFQSTDYADAAYAYRAGTDPPGTMREPVTLKDGEGPYNKTRGGLNRWGDYSGSYVDPADDLSLWSLQEYARIPTGPAKRDGSGHWGTWWGRVGGGPPLTPPQCVVPKVVGKPLGTAWRRLADAHCRLGKLRRVRTAKRLKGRVVHQSAPAGQQRRSDARVNLVLGR